MAMLVYADLRISEAEELADYQGIEFDFKSAQEFSHALAEDGDKYNLTREAADAFMVAAIVRYARPFSSGVRTRLGDDILEKLFSLTEQESHKRILDIRNKYVAHSVNAFEESTPVVRYWAERQEDAITSVDCMHMRVMRLSSKEMYALHGLCSKLLSYVRDKIETEKSRVLEIVRQMPFQEVIKHGPGGINRAILDPAESRKKSR